MTKSAQKIFIGTSGWRYEGWRDGAFYPPNLPPQEELKYLSSHFNSIEINGSFYSLQTPGRYFSWDHSTADDFKFAIKGSRYITHIRRLKAVEQALANFFASGVLALGRKMGPFLWQFPPNFKYDKHRLDRFAEILPKTVGQAIELAQSHDHRVKNAFAELRKGTKKSQKLQHAFEIRNQSFCTNDYLEFLRKNRFGHVIADTAGKWPFFEDVTAEFVYIRLHGDVEIYKSGYTDTALSNWARKIERWHRGGEPRGAKRIEKRSPPTGMRDVYVYFDNDVKVFAPYDAIKLFERFYSSNRFLERPLAA